jgi:hypothetical protein
MTVRLRRIAQQLIQHDRTGLGQRQRHLAIPRRLCSAW